MAIFELSDQDYNFPPAWLANSDGLLAIGGGLEPERVLEAYKAGIFPWFDNDEEPMWWSPDPRFVLYPEKIKISKSMRQVLRKGTMRVTFNQAFEQVMRNCGTIERAEQDGSWITQQMLETYTQLHHQNFAHSVEVWQGDDLVGGLYGGVLGRCFFGESMFSKVSNASKLAFITLALNLHKLDYELIDCQMHTPHLESLGGEYISRDLFLDSVFRNQYQELTTQEWAKQMQTNPLNLLSNR